MRYWIFDFDALSHASGQSNALQHSELMRVMAVLSETAEEQVVVVSHAPICDVEHRAAMPEAIIGGCNGAEWRFADGSRISFVGWQSRALPERRMEIVPVVEAMASRAGVASSDNYWNVTMCGKNLHTDVRQQLYDEVEQCSRELHFTYFVGTSGLIDIQLLPNFNKAVGITFLSSVITVDPSKDRIMYIGAGEHDAVAVCYALLSGGRGILLGEKMPVRGAVFLKKLSHLAGAVAKVRASL